ncbi:autotransporter-associated beta strand protein [Pseudomonas alcaligenes]|nr:autotransporter-associated beta strand protein [Pseudomonas alcaligenes]
MWLKKTAPVQTAARPAKSALAMALEPRMMFDGAVAATAAEVADTQATAQAADAQSTADASSSHDNLAATPTGTSDNRQEIVFVDGQVQDYQQLLAGMKQGTEVVVLDPKGDGLKQISDYLAGRTGIDAIHIVSHGLPGQVTLGSLTLDKAGLDARSADLGKIGQSLDADGDILFYGCDVGSGAAGQSFVNQVAQLTGADIAASNDATGAASRGGDWALEVTSGSIEAVTPFSASAQQAFSGRLFAGTLNFSGADTSLGISVTDGEANSTDIPGQVIEIYSANTGNTNNGANWGYSGDLFGDGLGGADEGIRDESGGGAPSIIIRSQSGAEFSFTGIRVFDYLGAHSQITFEAFRDGVSLGSVTLATDGSDFISDFSQSNGLTASIFQNVDEVRITDPSSGDGRIYVGLDNIGFADAPPSLVSATFADNNLKIGETSIVTFTFSSAVSGFTTADLTVPNGNISGLASSDGGLTWTGLFTPNSSVTDATNVITVDMTGVNAVSGGLAGVGTANSVNYAIDTAAPTVTSVTSSTGNGTYKAGDVISVQVNFGESVTVGGTPQLTLETGSTDRTVNYASGSGTSTLTFNYTVQAGDTAADLDYISTSALVLNGGSIRDVAGNDAVLTLAAPGTAGSLGANKDIAINSATVIGNLNGDSVAWAGVGNTVTLDASGNATFNDTEFGALNGGNGDWAGAILSVQAVGGALSSDVFGFNTVGANFTISGNTLQSGGQTFATFTSTGGVLTITFTSSGTSATTALVNDVAQHITYRSDTPTGDTTIRFSLNDGSSTTTADTTVTSDIIYITNTTDTATIDRSNGVSFSEAVAIAAADGTGSQTLIFTSAFSSGMSLAGNLAIAESLTINADSANGLSINGSTITLGGGTTLNFTNASGSVTIASTLAGTGALSKGGVSGTLLLTSTSNEANMSGDITVTGGALQITNDDQLSSGTLTLNGGTLTNGSTAANIDNAIAIGASGGTINVGGGTGATQLTLSGVISGSGTLVKNGAAILQLDGNNTYTGDTNLTAGTLILNHANALGTTAGGTTVTAGTSVRINGGLTVAEDFTVNGTGKTVSAVDYGALHLVSGSSTLSGSVTFTGDTNISAASGSTLTLSGALGGGAYNLNKTDAGTLILSNAGNEAGLTGGTTITAGTLSVANDDYLAAGTLTLNGGTLAITGATTIDNAIAVASASTISATANATLSGALSGANALTKSGASTLTLAGTSSGHFGALNITAGGVTLSGGSALGDTSAVTLSSGTTLTVSSAEAIGSLAGAGSVVLNGALTIGGDNTSTTYSGVISGASGLTKVGSGTQTLTGANSFTGATSISAGGLTVGSGGALGNDSAVTVSSGATLTVTAASLAVGSLAGAGTVSIGANTFTSGSNNSSTTFSGAISGSGTFGKAGSGTLTLSGTNSGSSAAILVNGGMLAVAADANLTSGTVTLQNSNLRVTGATTIDNDIALTGGSGGIVADAAVTLSGVISGGSLLAKSGTGTLTLTGTNTYSGATNVVSGSLIVDGALSATSGVVVSSGATLGGSGSIFASNSTNTLTVQNGGTLSPGNGGAGALTVNGNLLMNSGSTLALDINGTSAGTQYDQVIVNGTVDVSGATLAVTHAYAAGTGDSYSIIVNDAADAVTGTFSGLSEGGVVTAGGNATPLTASYIAGTGNDFTLTAPIAPTVTSVSSSTANGTYKIGDTITVTITFDTTVDVTGTPRLQLETGAVDRTLDYVSGSGSNTLTFSYTVQAGDSSADLDYASTSALSLNGGTIRDGSSRDAILTLPTPGAAGSLGANKALVVDGVRPVATSITLSDTNLRIGETATVTITFAEAVTGLDAGDLTVAGGTIGALSSADGGITWTTTFTPTSNLTSGTNVITLNNTGVMDLAGNIGSGSTDSGNYAIDTQRPTATIVVTDSVLKAGQTTTVTITFNEAVTGLGIGDFLVDNGTLSGLSSNDGGITWTATLTPSATITDTSNLITLDNTGVQDLAGNAGSGSTDSNNYGIDTQLPTATIVVADTALKAGQTTTVTITFSEAVSGLTTADFSVANGALSNLSSSDGGITWTATLTPGANVTDSTNVITLNNAGYTDLAGNAGLGSTDSNNYAIDSLAPAVTSVTVPANGTYGPGQNLDFTVNFGEAVTVDTLGGMPRLVITLDTGGTAYAEYLSGSGTTALVFRLVVTSGQADANGISVGGALQANGGTLRDAAGNDAVTTLNSVGDTSAVLVDAVAPRVTDIALDGTSPTTNSSVSFTVTFSEDVTGLDLADFNLLTGGSVSGTLQSLVQLTGNTWRVTVSGVTGQGSLGLSLPAIASGVADGQGNAMVDSYSTIGYQIGSLDNGDPEFRANPPVTTPTETPAPLQPTVPSAPPPSTTTSPLIPPPLFEQPTLGSGIPTVGNIFINNGALAPSFIAQVFASSDSSSDGGGAGFLGFGGGDGGVFGASTFSGLFSKDKPQESNEKIFDKQRSNGQGGRSFGAPTLGQQLHEMKEAEQRQVRQLAQALGQVAGTAAQG